MTLDDSILLAMHTPRLHQISLVVEDMPRAVQHFKHYLGLGPWYRAAPGPAHDIWYRGQPVDCTVDFVMTFAGAIQFELVHTQGDPNLYTEHLEKYGEGLHHIGFFVSDFQRKVNAYNQAGFETLQRGHIVSKGGSVTDYAYFDFNPDDKRLVYTEVTATRLAGRIPVRMTPLMMKLGVLTGDLVPV
jgi:catechol 2,3-dioxygenase-like lactoylglutathione lyase family enzyme